MKNCPECKKIDGECDKCRVFRERLEEMTTARASIIKMIGKDHTDEQGEVPCTKCEGGMLQFRRSGYNGHIHARCTTDGCLMWME